MDTGNTTTGTLSSSSHYSGDSRKSAVLEHVRFQSLQSLLSEISQIDTDDVEEEEKSHHHHDDDEHDCSSALRIRKETTRTTTTTSTRHESQQRIRDDVKNPKVLKKLQKMEKKAIALLDTLESPPTSKSVHHQGPTMPISAIRFSKYLVFLWQRKVGCIVSYEWRYGFILYQGAPGVWSEPVFVKHRYISVGATCGWSCGESVFAISDDASMVEFIKQSSLDILPNMASLDCRYSTDSVNATITCKRLGTHVTRYHIDSAASYIVDLSFKIGRESIDTGMHEALHGSPSVSARDILDRHVSCCTTLMHDLHAYLGAKCMRSGSMARETKKLFHEERTSIYNSMSLVQRRSSSCLKTHTGTLSSTSSLNGTVVPQPADTTCLFEDSQLLDLDLGDP